MAFFNSAVGVLQTLVIALGAGLGIWGVINLLEGYGNDNPGAKSQGMKQLMAGGGVAPVSCVEALEKFVATLQGDERTGAVAVLKALTAPLHLIAQNAGYQGDVVVEKVRGLKAGSGLNAVSGEYVDMIEAGIIDPVKVTRSALQNAGSIAAMVLTTEAIVADKPEKKEPAMPGGMGGMGGMGDMY